MSTRLPDWEALLSAFIAASWHRPHEWGQWDCALWGTACAAEITGEDKAAKFRGAYDSREGAARALRELGKGTLIKTMDSLYPPKPPSLAQRGDLVMAQGAIGVSMGAVAMFVGEEGDREGLVTVPRHEWTRAWAV